MLRSRLRSTSTSRGGVPSTRRGEVLSGVDGPPPSTAVIGLRARSQPGCQLQTCSTGGSRGSATRQSGQIVCPILGVAGTRTTMSHSLLCVDGNEAEPLLSMTARIRDSHSAVLRRNRAQIRPSYRTRAASVSCERSRFSKRIMTSAPSRESLRLDPTTSSIRRSQLYGNPPMPGKSTPYLLDPV
jgi:hypothetical protein